MCCSRVAQVSKLQGKQMVETKPLQIDPEYLKMAVDQFNVALSFYCALLNGKLLFTEEIIFI
jgi:hypothetical protein